MNIEPVENLPAPEYPDKYSDEIQNLLTTTYPRRWIIKPLVVGALTVTAALSLSSCRIFGTIGSTDGLQSTYIPIFEYGNGTGSVGCDAVSAPVFMSEEEAFVIMQAAFAEAKLTLSNQALSVKNATRPIVDQYSHQSENYISGKKRDALETDGTLELDQSIPVVFVSLDELYAWQRAGGSYSTASIFRFKDAARVLADNNPGLIVFYDPVTNLWEKPVSGGSRAETVEQAQAESGRLLRQQVLAFIEWLQAETSR